MSAGESGGVNSDINVTPMIDVLLVLLIIFMVVIALGRTAMDIQIPPVDTGTRQQNAKSDQIVLELRDNGSFAINGQAEFALAQLDQQIHGVFDNRPAKLLFVKPGQTRKYGEIIAALDIARGAGVEVLGWTPIESN
jgi:biopolymer transport protein ExbD